MYGSSDNLHNGIRRPSLSKRKSRTEISKREPLPAGPARSCLSSVSKHRRAKSFESVSKKAHDSPKDQMTKSAAHIEMDCRTWNLVNRSIDHTMQGVSISPKSPECTQPYEAPEKNIIGTREHQSSTSKHWSLLSSNASEVNSEELQSNLSAEYCHSLTECKKTEEVCFSKCRYSNPRLSHKDSLTNPSLEHKRHSDPARGMQMKIFIPLRKISPKNRTNDGISAVAALPEKKKTAVSSGKVGTRGQYKVRNLKRRGSSSFQSDKKLLPERMLRSMSVRSLQEHRRHSSHKGKTIWLESQRGRKSCARVFKTPESFITKIMNGMWIIKHHYMQRSSVERWIYLSKDKKHLCWKRRWSHRQSSIDLENVIGFLIGPKSRRFQQMSAADDNFLNRYNPWKCCSVVLNYRTVDLTFQADEVLLDWVLTLQKLTPNALFKWHRPNVVRQIGWMKLRHAIKTKGMQQLVRQFKAATQELYKEHIRLARSLWSRIPRSENPASVISLIRQQTGLSSPGEEGKEWNAESAVHSIASSIDAAQYEASSPQKKPAPSTTQTKPASSTRSLMPSYQNRAGHRQVSTKKGGSCISFDPIEEEN
eukprot:CAMPEP_0184493508 /NCGR_PEP_ID=MMETSP0113_2-20130426/26182_1 /TAXON_ID=91329 /ORGANISM="Norrisiella sphaerica, Strain BC52" /LENGTH=591 /DNA_ID=CAMNT_0026878789 /DNA_START=285 /DNA_END=2060 /DNA_ORIENTATION=+